MLSGNKNKKKWKCPQAIKIFKKMNMLSGKKIKKIENAPGNKNKKNLKCPHAIKKKWKCLQAKKIKKNEYAINEQAIKIIKFENSLTQ